MFAGVLHRADGSGRLDSGLGKMDAWAALPSCLADQVSAPGRGRFRRGLSGRHGASLCESWAFTRCPRRNRRHPRSAR